MEGTTEFKAMGPMKRNCLYPEEKELTHFPIYSEPNCVLECAWNYAAKKCNCAPWFLYSHFPEVNTCEAHGNLCFFDIVKTRYDLADDECMDGCLPDCETVEYHLGSLGRDSPYE